VGGFLSGVVLGAEAFADVVAVARGIGLDDACAGADGVAVGDAVGIGDADAVG
jgi:hypothetical protein